MSAGTYRLTAEDPTGLYDFVDNRFEFNGKAPAKNINLAVFEGLKMTVRIPASSPAFILPVKQNLGNSPMLQDPGVVVDLAVDWGDGGESALTKNPNGYEDPAFTHRYAAPRDYTIRIKGKCWGTEPNGKREYDYKGKFGMSFTRIGEGNGEQAGHSGPITLPVEGFALDENKDKLIRLAGNITALTKPDAKNGFAYCYAFESCNKLEDISGLAFTDTGASGEYFMQGTFNGCAITAIPPDFAPRGLTTMGEHFMHVTFENTKKLVTIGPRFLPDSLTNAGDLVLVGTFKGCSKLAAIPDRFLPQNLATIGGGFLSDAFISSGIAEIPAGFLPDSIERVGISFLANTFSNLSKIKAIPDNFLPATLKTAGDSFLYSTFSGTSITAVPENFIPANLTTVGTGFLSNTFSGCTALTTADITVSSSLTNTGSFMYRTFYNCARLDTLDLFKGGAAPANIVEALSGAAAGKSAMLTLRIYSNAVLAPVTAAAGLLDTNIAALEVPTALVNTYKSDEKWGGGPVNQDKIIALQAIQG